MNKEPLLKVENLSVTFFTPRGTVTAVREASFEISRGEVLGIVGESGCGKSTTAFAVMGYLPTTAETGGSISFEGKDISSLSAEDLREIRGNRIAMVYQDPTTSLNPSMKIGLQVQEVISEHLDLDQTARYEKVVELFESVGLADAEQIGDRYPHELCGGMKQRVIFALALDCDPDLLIMDEPTTGLDVTTEATILDLVASLKERVNAGILYVTHNLGVIARVADRVAVMYAGQTVEQSDVKDLFASPKHPYTSGLLSCVPKPPGEGEVSSRLKRIPGFVYSSQEAVVNSCLFAERCPLADSKCTTTAPNLEFMEENSQVRCFHSSKVSPDTWGGAEERISRKDVDSPTVLTGTGITHEYGKRRKKYMAFGPDIDLPVRALNKIDFKMAQGKTLGIVGESGSGKSTLARAVVGLIKAQDGSLQLNGSELDKIVENRSNEDKSAIQMVFQNPTASLNPKLKIKKTLIRSLIRFSKLTKQESEDRAASLMEEVGLDPSYLERLPSELSGGEQQRVAIAGAFATNPEIVVADEAVSALDVSVQAQVLGLLEDRQHELGNSYLFITHDLGVVRYISDDIMVVYAGHIAEYGPSESVLGTPSHPYTEALLSAAPIPDPDANPNPLRLEGAVPTMREQFTGCFFASRCPRKLGSICDTETPPIQNISARENHVINCHIPVEDLEKMQS
ncbi:MAG: ABC transporter ATP-binding protein [Chloroflexota bacterium]|nr:ABC transporter ATP-binding protein [Chloroflexota bacterium]